MKTTSFKEKDDTVLVSIVIVCMNNLRNLYPCLESIRKYTTVSYETFVVAYLFSEENLKKAKQDFPWVTFIESNEIRGFSENNNLALRKAVGKYCYILNDDTFMDSPVIDRLVDTMERQKESVAVVSPNIVYPDGRPQFCGRNEANFWTFLLSALGARYKDSQFTSRAGVFKTYNIMGAAFLIRTDVFRSVGWFDEYFFFCPEDIALSMLLNKKGYECIVDGDITQYHVQGVSSCSLMQTATEPAHIKGSIAFYSENSIIKKIVLTGVYVLRSLVRALAWRVLYILKKEEKAKIKTQVYVNVAKGILSAHTPKELFMKYYSKIKQDRSR